MTPTSTATPLPAVGLAPSALAFPTGGAAAFGPVPVTVTNQGPGELTISAVSLDGGDAGAFTASGCQGQTLAPGGTCQVAVTFDKLTRDIGDGKGNYSASLVIADNAQDSPQRVPLSAALPPPSVSISPQELDFPPDTVTVTNTGDGAQLVIANIMFAGPGFKVVDNTCIEGVVAGSSCTIQVGFTDQTPPICPPPSQGIAFCGVMTITDNAGSGQQTINLREVPSIL